MLIITITVMSRQRPSLQASQLVLNSLHLPDEDEYLAWSDESFVEGRSA